MDSDSAAPTVSLELEGLGRAAWRIFAQQPAAHVGAFLLVLVLGAATAGLLAPALLVGYLRLIERARQDEPVTALHVFDGISSVGPALLVGLLYVLAVAIGSLLILLPGLIIAVGWAYAPWFVAIDGLAAGAALRAAWTLARQQTGPLLLVLLTVVGTNLIGGLFLVGVLLTGPLGLIAMSLAFDQLKGR